MRKLITVLALVALTCTHAIHAVASSEMTAADLYSFCNSKDSNIKLACGLYILGVVQGIGVATGVANDKEHFCIPDDISTSQLVAIFQKTAQKLKQAYPNDMNMPAIGMVGSAMVHEFPCVNQRPIK